jgi:hypothetical protein
MSGLALLFYTTLLVKLFGNRTSTYSTVILESRPKPNLLSLLKKSKHAGFISIILHYRLVRATA